MDTPMQHERRARLPRQLKQIVPAAHYDGWTITHDPFTFRFGLPSLLRVDLGAEMRGNVLEAQRGYHQIAIEIKSFTKASISTDLYMAVDVNFGDFCITLKKVK